MAGLLGDIFSYGNTLKRKVNGLLDDPRGTLDQFVGQLGDQTRSNNALADMAGWGLDKAPFVSVLADNRPSIGQGTPQAITPQMREAAQRLVAENAANSGMAAPIQSFHNDVLKSYSKGVPDDVANATFGVDGYIYHTPYRPFENAQQTAIGVKATPIGERIFSTTSPLDAKTLKSIEAIPVSDSASRAFAKELGDEGAMGFLNKDGKRFSVVMPSAKNQGMYQATQYDPKGAIGDSQHPTQENAILRMMNGGYSKVLEDNRIEGLLSKVMLAK